METSWVPRRVSALIAALACCLAACGGGDGGTAATTTAPTTTAPTTTAVVAADCDRVTPLVAASAIPSSGTCRDWVDTAMGRAVRGSTGSASVWSRRTEHGTALIVGAVHTLGQGWFGPAGTPVDEAITDPADQVGVPRLFLLLPDGSGPDELASPWFGLYRPAIAAERNGNLMQDVLPREDVYVAVTDTQKLAVEGPAPTPEPIVLGSVPLHDPRGATLAEPTFAEPVDDALVLLLGYPHETGELTIAVGRVLGPEEADRAVATLADLGDPEGAIAYDGEAEFILEGAAAAGMSGGPVVDRQGRLVGVMVRASDPHDGVQYVRAVRMTFVAARVAAAFAALPSEAQAAVQGYLER